MNTSQFYFNVILNGVVEGLIIALAALSLTLVFAVARFANAATGDYMTFGAYVAKAAWIGGPFGIFAAGLAASVATAGISVLFYGWVFRRLASRSHVAALVASIGVALLLRHVLTLVVGQDPTTMPVPLVRATRIFGLLVQPTDLWVAAAAVLALLLVFGLLHLTPMGRRLRAIADNADLARASGIRSTGALIVLWAVVGIVAAIGGILLAVKSVLHPELGWHFLLPGFTAAIVGGIGNPLGAVIGGLAIGLFQESSALVVGHSYKIAVSFVILAALLLWRPQGLLGRREEMR